MNLQRIVLVNFRRALFSSGFLYCVLAVFVMCFTNVIGTDSKTMDPLTIPDVLMQPSLIEENVSYCSFQVFTAGSPIWLTMFTPVLAAFAYIPLFCDERRTQLGRLLILRQGKLQYAIGHVCAALLVGGCTMLLGYALFGLAVALLFPPLESYEPTQITMFLEEQSWVQPQWYSDLLAEGKYAVIILIRFVEMFLYGAFSAMPALICTTITQNKYLVLCAPFFVVYVWNQFNTRLQAKLIYDLNSNAKLREFLWISKTDALLSVFENRTVQILLLHGIVLLILAAAFCIILQRRRDCGA